MADLVLDVVSISGCMQYTLYLANLIKMEIWAFSLNSACTAQIDRDSVV